MWNLSVTENKMQEESKHLCSINQNIGMLTLLEFRYLENIEIYFLPGSPCFTEGEVRSVGRILCK